MKLHCQLSIVQAQTPYYFYLAPSEGLKPSDGWAIKTIESVLEIFNVVCLPEFCQISTRIIV